MGRRGPKPTPSKVLRMRGNWRGKVNKGVLRPPRQVPGETADSGGVETTVRLTSDGRPGRSGALEVVPPLRLAVQAESFRRGRTRRESLLHESRVLLTWVAAQGRCPPWHHPSRPRSQERVVSGPAAARHHETCRASCVWGPFVEQGVSFEGSGSGMR